MDNLLKSFAYLIGIIGLAIILVLYAIFVQAFIAYKCYEWFILWHVLKAPVFTFIEFIGFRIFLGAIMPVSTIPNLKEDYYAYSKTVRAVVAIIIPWIFLLMAYLTHIFIVK